MSYNNNMNNKEELIERLVEELKHVMAVKGVTAYRLAIIMGVSKQSINQYFTGRRAWSVDRVLTILDALDVKYDFRIKGKFNLKKSI